MVDCGLTEDVMPWCKAPYRLMLSVTEFWRIVKITASQSCFFLTLL